MAISENSASVTPEFLRSAISREIEIAINEEFEEAKRRIEKRKAEISAGVLLHVQKMIQMETMGQKLIVTVSLD